MENSEENMLVDTGAWNWIPGRSHPRILMIKDWIYTGSNRRQRK